MKSLIEELEAARLPDKSLHAISHGAVIDTAINLTRYHIAQLQSPEVRDMVALVLWDWEHEGRKNQILDVEWILLKSDYCQKAQAALACIVKLMEGEP